MAYFEQKILSGIPGGNADAEYTRQTITDIGTITVSGITSGDIGGTWVGPLSGHPDGTSYSNNSVYFNTTDKRFYYYNGSTWVQTTPTDTRVFGASGRWLGAVNGQTGSQNVNTQDEAARWLDINGFASNVEYFYYDDEEDPIVRQIDSYTASTDVPGGLYLGPYTTAQESSLSGANNRSYFNTTTAQWRLHNGTSWSNVNPTNAGIFGQFTTSTDPNVPPKTITWLGENNGAAGSQNVRNYTTLQSFFSSNTYSTALAYYFYNADSGQVEHVTDYLIPTAIEIVKGNLEKSYINKAVTFDEGFTIHNPKVRLCRDNEFVLGSIIGYSYNKLQIAVSGWNIKFINGDANPLNIGRKIIGKTFREKGGFVQEGPLTSAVSGNEEKKDNSRGIITGSGYDDVHTYATSGGSTYLDRDSIVTVSLVFGGW